jgi:hypothetical protein
MTNKPGFKALLDSHAARLNAIATACFTVCIALMFAPGVVSAHHSIAGRFNSQSIMEVEGEITSVNWRSPHVEYTLDAINENGIRETWLLEGAAPSTLVRSGLSSDFLKVGDQVRVAGWAPVTDKLEIFLQNLLQSTGEEILLWVTADSRWTQEQANDFAFWLQSEGDASRPELGIFRIWSSSLALRPPGGRNTDYPLTESASEAMQVYASSGENLAIQACVPKGMPLSMEQPYPFEFSRDGDDIVLRLEEYDAIRTIFMNHDQPPAGTPNSSLGYSVGRWEDETLVVTTTLLDWPWFSQSGIPQSTESILVERFTPTEDGSLLNYELTATDPINFTEPFTQNRQWLYLADQQIRPYECHTSSED